jgi:hypothetical protein
VSAPATSYRHAITSPRRLCSEVETPARPGIEERGPGPGEGMHLTQKSHAGGRQLIACQA